MDWLKRKRIKQVLQYGWKDSKEISAASGKNRLAIWCDIIKCFRRYYIFSNQYKQNKVWMLTEEERKHLSDTLGQKNRYRDEWTVWKYENAAFVEKYSGIEYGTSPVKYRERLEAYRKRYHIDEGCTISNQVVIERNHYLEGSIKIGKNVLLSKNVYIDYSGEVVVKDNVQLTNGVIIESHHHPFHSDPTVSRDIVIPTSIVIEEGAVVGSRAIILASCHYIGKYARIGAGAVVTKDIPDYAVAAGVPARVVRMLS